MAPSRMRIRLQEARRVSQFRHGHWFPKQSAQRTGHPCAARRPAQSPVRSRHWHRSVVMGVSGESEPLTRRVVLHPRSDDDEGRAPHAAPDGEAPRFREAREQGPWRDATPATRWRYRRSHQQAAPSQSSPRFQTMFLARRRAAIALRERARRTNGQSSRPSSPTALAASGDTPRHIRGRPHQPLATAAPARVTTQPNSSGHQLVKFVAGAMRSNFAADPPHFLQPGNHRPGREVVWVKVADSHGHRVANTPTRPRHRRSAGTT